MTHYPTYSHRRRLNLRILGTLVAVLTLGGISSLTTFGHSPAHDVSQQPKILATQTLSQTHEGEVGLDIEARSVDASWSKKGSEAASVLISVDGKYNQDLMLWAGDDLFHYRVTLGRIGRGSHTISLSLNQKRSAAGAQQAEIKSVQPLLFGSASNDEQLALAHSPILFARANTIDHFTDIPLLMYYEILRNNDAELTVRYTTIFTNEDGGTQTAALMARWGRATDIEWVYQFRMRNGRIVEEIYQGVQHETKNFTGARAGGHPLLAVASDNNNFSDLASSAVRFAPLPIRARLENATRESVMDSYPQTYRVMTEELLREGRISETPVDINTIADPREYLYIEAVSEQINTTIAFDVKIAGKEKAYASDMNEPRLRIDRSGYFRTSVRLPKNVSPSDMQTVTAVCHASAKPAAERYCKNLRLVRVLRLDENYVPRDLQVDRKPESTLAADEKRVFRLFPP